MGRGGTIMSLVKSVLAEGEERADLRDPYYHLLMAVVRRAKLDAGSADPDMAEEAQDFLDDLHDELAGGLDLETDACQYLGI